MDALTLGSEVTISTIISGVAATAVDATPLLTALITFGVSLVTLAGGELVKFLVAYFKAKTKKLEESDKKDDKKNEE